MATLVAAEVPWMARLEEMIQPRARALAESSCHSFSTNEILGALGEQPVLHFCDFPEYRTGELEYVCGVLLAACGYDTQETDCCHIYTACYL